MNANDDPVVKVFVVPEGYLIHLENPFWRTRLIIGPRTSSQLIERLEQAFHQENTGQIQLALLEWPVVELPKQGIA